LKKISFIHTADLHLDSPMIGLRNLPEKIYHRLINSTFTALRKIVDTAIERKVDFLIIAGDVFDGEDRSLRAQIRFRQEMERLLQHHIAVYLVHGNHDHLGGNWTKVELPHNVTIFGDEVEQHSFKNGTAKVHLYGFSYPRRQVFERRINEYQKVDGADYHIGILHGNDGGESTHSNYAPFSLGELLEKDFDYWALGHIHKRKKLSESPPVIYPGNIQGRHHKEQGPKGCYLVTLNNGLQQLDWIETSDVEWDSLSIDVGTCSTFLEVYQLCLNKIHQMRNEGAKARIVQLEIKNVNQMEGIEGVFNGELLALLQEDEVEEKDFIWISSINMVKDVYDKELLKEDGFYNELSKTINQYEQINEAIEPLYKHPLGRKHLTPLTAEEQKNIMNEAEQILIRLLYEKTT
jgi:DNA repair protein SbcD/Mre11